MGFIERISSLNFSRIRQAVLHNPMERKYYKTAELRKMGFASVGNNVRIEQTCVIVNPGYISIGNDVIIDQFTFLIAGSPGLKIGSWIHIAGHNLLGGNAGLILEDFSNVAAGSKIITSSDDFGGGYLVGPAVPQEFTNVKSGPITLGENTILGAGTVLLPGCNCAVGTATGANAVVVKPTEPWGIYTGAPAQRIRDRKQDCQKLAEQVRAKRQPN